MNVHAANQLNDSPHESNPFSSFLVEALGRRHGSLDGQATNVLPALLQQRNEVVDGQHDVTNQLILGHANISDGHTHAEHLLQLELDGGLDLVDLVGEVFGVGNGRGELSGLGETGAKETGNLLDESVGGNEGIVLARELCEPVSKIPEVLNAVLPTLDELFVLVQLLQVVAGHGVNTMMLSAINIVLVTEDADGHAGAGDGREADGSRETLVTLGIVVLQADLEFDRFQEVALLGLIAVLEEFLDRVSV